MDYQPHALAQVTALLVGLNVYKWDIWLLDYKVKVSGVSPR